MSPFETILVLAVTICFQGHVTSAEYLIHHQCFHKAHECETRNFTCEDGATINITWSRVGYSRYWHNTARSNCSISDDTCYEKTDKLDHCSGQTQCFVDGCDNALFKRELKCAADVITNFMRVNYSCTSQITSTTAMISTITIATQITTTTTETSDPGTESNTESLSRERTTINNKQTTPETRDSAPWVIPVAVVIGVLVAGAIAAIIVIVIRRGRRQTDREKEKPETLSNAENNNTDGTDLVDNANYASSGYNSEQTNSPPKAAPVEDEHGYMTYEDESSEKLTQATGNHLNGRNTELNRESAGKDELEIVDNELYNSSDILTSNASNGGVKKAGDTVMTACRWDHELSETIDPDYDLVGPIQDDGFVNNVPHQTGPLGDEYAMIVKPSD